MDVVGKGLVEGVERLVEGVERLPSCRQDASRRIILKYMEYEIFLSL